MAHTPLDNIAAEFPAIVIAPSPTGWQSGPLYGSRLSRREPSVWAIS